MVNDMDLESVWFVWARDAIYVKEMINSIEARFLGGFGELGDQTVVTNVRHAESLQQCSDEMERVLEGLESGFTGDLLAFHLRAGIRALSGITGEIGVEEILGSIFSKFCIGK
jgi:tRNA U34 5-carboxymethylaminomethyl modifying GTPase MnmE/TrmE